MHHRHSHPRRSCWQDTTCIYLCLQERLPKLVWPLRIEIGIPGKSDLLLRWGWLTDDSYEIIVKWFVWTVKYVFWPFSWIKACQKTLTFKRKMDFYLNANLGLWCRSSAIACLGNRRSSVISNFRGWARLFSYLQKTDLVMETMCLLSFVDTDLCGLYSYSRIDTPISITAYRSIQTIVQWWISIHYSVDAIPVANKIDMELAKEHYLSRLSRKVAQMLSLFF